MLYIKKQTINHFFTIKKIVEIIPPLSFLQFQRIRAMQSFFLFSLNDYVADALWHIDELLDFAFYKVFDSIKRKRFDFAFGH